jgi:hypothetical protein
MLQRTDYFHDIPMYFDIFDMSKQSAPFLEPLR